MKHLLLASVVLLFGAAQAGAAAVYKPKSQTQPEAEAIPEAAPPVTADQLASRITPEEAQAIALKAVPGTPLQVNEKYAGDELYYSFMIGVEDGSIYEVPVRAKGGELAQISIESLSKRPKNMPFAIIPQQRARDTAEAYVMKEVPGKRRPFMRDGKLTVLERMPVYVYESNKSNRWYTVTVDAQSGEVVNLQGNQ